MKGKLPRFFLGMGCLMVITYTRGGWEWVIPSLTVTAAVAIFFGAAALFIGNDHRY